MWLSELLLWGALKGVVGLHYGLHAAFSQDSIELMFLFNSVTESWREFQKQDWSLWAMDLTSMLTITVF